MKANKIRKEIALQAFMISIILLLAGGFYSLQAQEVGQPVQG